MEENLNQYGLYPASYCRALGLPMYNHDDYGQVADRYLSKTRCKTMGKPVEPGEEPVAFYKCQNGYTPLYYRERGEMNG